jgi:hypothetical protein
MTLPFGSMTKALFVKRSGKSGSFAFACAMSHKCDNLLVMNFIARVLKRLSSYREREEFKEKLEEEVKGHNHPISEKCGLHCPRNEHFKGPVKKPGLPHK